jgi:pathogenesis-related protein 1
MQKVFFLFILFCTNQVYSQQVIHFDSLGIAAILEEHNKERRLVGTADLMWDEGIALYAQEWALKLAKDDSRLRHRDETSYGENISFFAGYEFQPALGVSLWNEEKVDYRYSKIGESGSDESMHYTQVIWGNSSRVGCGCAQSASGSYFFVCNYDPAGNYIGQYPYER